jgi:hypothetical protein
MAAAAIVYKIYQILKLRAEVKETKEICKEIKAKLIEAK